MTDVKGKVVLVTGSASGIGYCLAEEFVRAGSTVIMTDRDELKLMDAEMRLRQCGGAVHAYVVDISNESEVAACIDRIRADVGPIDILINNAGIGHNAEIVETTLQTWKRLMDVNFWGALYHIYAVLPAMIERNGGHIVNVSSGQAFFRLPTWSVYATIKLALGAFSEMLSYEIAKFGINVTTVYPFMVNTPFYQHITGDTYFGKLSMRLVPWYSNSPETVARKVFNAVKHNQRTEMVNPINYAGFISHAIPPLGHLVAMLSACFLGKKREDVSLTDLREQLDHMRA